MKLNRHAFVALFHKEFNANFHEAARQLHVDVSQIHRIVTKNKGAGIVFLNRLADWCVLHNRDYRDYIFLPEVLASANNN